MKTEKIYLKEGLTEENYPLLLAWFGDLEIMKYIGWVKRGLALKNINLEFIARMINLLVTRRLVILKVKKNANLGYLF
ncbi:MAG: hypothetical protein UR65_C0086G0003 [Candidatus Moranbacteria bacterium GW2011_GWE2_35_164]|nr:MAG: hypothetical protein UR65_C0086G0003 [Candidatus Moranbacteria bacterium GW2011_GWE2_35_164]